MCDEPEGRDGNTDFDVAGEEYENYDEESRIVDMAGWEAIIVHHGFSYFLRMRAICVVSPRVCLDAVLFVWRFDLHRFRETWLHKALVAPLLHADQFSVFQSGQVSPG